MKEWLEGNPLFMLAVLLSGVWAWVAASTSYYTGLTPPFKVFEANGWFALGGLLFGLGTAFNQGCGVSTLSKLSRGNLPMSATLVGWVIGWCALANLQPDVTVFELAPPSIPTYGALAVMSALVSVWALIGDKSRKKLWFGMMGIGLLAGFLFLYEPRWTPSALLHDVSAAALHGENSRWPPPPRYYLLLALIGGMVLAAWHTKRFDFKTGHWTAWSIHLVAGTLMGLGASLAMGGNDSQLLLALPAFSPAGFLAVTCMLLGIVLGIKIHQRLTVHKVIS
ncbi:MAG: YeeE/YedE thiosulfate transporter family protein [Halopseudomonas sp.]